MLAVVSLCTPRQAEAEDLSFPTQGVSPVHVGVRTPEGKMVYLLDANYACAGVSVKSGRVYIDTVSASAAAWRDGKLGFVSAFPRAGKYQIYVSDNLETEADSADTWIYPYVVRRVVRSRAAPHCNKVG